jgi:hypothetical protein
MTRISTSPDVEEGLIFFVKNPIIKTREINIIYKKQNTVNLILFFLKVEKYKGFAPLSQFHKKSGRVKYLETIY